MKMLFKGDYAIIIEMQSNDWEILLIFLKFSSSKFNGLRLCYSAQFF